LAHRCVEFGDYERAESIYRELLQEDPAWADPMMDRALQLFQGGRSEAAERIARQVLQFPCGRSSVDQARVALAVLAWEAGRIEEAAEYAGGVASDAVKGDRSADAWIDAMSGVRRLLE
jgi:Flp pilus assembly protein TadD